MARGRAHAKARGRPPRATVRNPQAEHVETAIDTSTSATTTGRQITSNNSHESRENTRINDIQNTAPQQEPQTNKCEVDFMQGESHKDGQAQSDYEEDSSMIDDSYASYRLAFVKDLLRLQPSTRRKSAFSFGDPLFSLKYVRYEWLLFLYSFFKHLS